MDYMARKIVKQDFMFFLRWDSFNSHIHPFTHKKCDSHEILYLIFKGVSFSLTWHIGFPPPRINRLFVQHIPATKTLTRGSFKGPELWWKCWRLCDDGDNVWWLLWNGCNDNLKPVHSRDGFRFVKAHPTVFEQELYCQEAGHLIMMMMTMMIYI